MKKPLLATIIGLAFSLTVYAEPLVVDAPIKSVGTPVTVAISSTTITKVPTTQSLISRVGVYISNPSTSSVAGFVGDCTSTALASTIRPIEIAREVASVGSDGMFFIPLRHDTCLWLISTDVTFASRNIHYQEVAK